MLWDGKEDPDWFKTAGLNWVPQDMDDGPEPTTKVHRVVLMVIDHDGLGADAVTDTLRVTRYANRCIAPEPFSIETRDIGLWDDSHPLNDMDIWRGAFERLFKWDGKGPPPPMLGSREPT